MSRVIHRDPDQVRRIYAATVHEQQEARESGVGDWIEVTNTKVSYWAARAATCGVSRTNNETE